MHYLLLLLLLLGLIIYFLGNNKIIYYTVYFSVLQFVNNYCNIQQLLEEVEQNIVICQWRADQLLPNPKAEVNK